MATLKNIKHGLLYDTIFHLKQELEQSLTQPHSELFTTDQSEGENRIVFSIEKEANLSLITA